MGSDEYETRIAKRPRNASLSQVTSMEILPGFPKYLPKWSLYLILSSDL